MSFSVALAQTKPKLGCVSENLENIARHVEKARRDGASLVVFPELALTGYFLKDLVPEVALSLSSPEIGTLKKLSKDISIALGFVEVSHDYRFFNSAIYLENGEIKHVHRKVYLPTYGLFDEQRYLAQGNSFRAFDTRFGRVGFLLCEDMWHLPSSYILAMDGASTLICLASSPGRGLTSEENLSSTDAWQKLVFTTAMFLNMRVVFCNRAGFEDGVNFWGGSEVVDPCGTSITRGKLLEEDFVIASLDEGALRRARIYSPLMRDENLFITMKELHRVERKRDC
jgi:predicted amidohydrolase